MASMIGPNDITVPVGGAKRLQLIACKVMQREAYFCAARSRNVVDIVLMPQGLHNEPDRLRREVQKALERTRDIQDRPYDASLLGYGLCSNGVVGLGAEIPIVIPRAHDCITLLLGSKDRYQEYFDSHRGVYWYSPGWIESGKQPSQERYDLLLREYVQKYGAGQRPVPHGGRADLDEGVPVGHLCRLGPDRSRRATRRSPGNVPRSCAGTTRNAEATPD